MADFVDLKVQFGVGDYHLNRFRVVFTAPPGTTAASLAADFVAKFPTYFASQYATVETTKRQYNNHDTLRFHGFMKVLGVDLAAPHHDWVVQIWKNPSIGFTAQTLQRLFLDSDDVKASPAVILGGPLLGGEAVLTNQRHFLAGRRSWRLDNGPAFGLPANVMVLETAAIERFSAHGFQIGDAIGGLEKRIPKIWIANLTNFVTNPGLKLTVVPQTNQGGDWTSDTTDGRTRVDYVRITTPDLASLQSKGEYHKVLAVYPTIIDLNARKPGLWEKLERGPVF